MKHTYSKSEISGVYKTVWEEILIKNIFLETISKSINRGWHEYWLEKGSLIEQKSIIPPSQGIF